MTIRKAWRTDLPNLMKALVAFADKVEKQPDHYKFAKGFNLATGYSNLERSLDKCLYIDGFLVFYDTVTPWFGGRPILQEWFTIRIEDGGTVMGVPEQLRQWAAVEGYRAVLGGDSSPVGLMAAAYEANGFTPLTKQYFKEA